jgi:hypothetical protein
MARFTAIPDVPTRVAAEWESQMLDALKQNVELLAGLRGESDSISRAIRRGDVRVRLVPVPTFTRVTAEAKGFTISGERVADFDDYNKLINDVQRLGNDVVLLRQVVNALISQMRGLG